MYLIFPNSSYGDGKTLRSKYFFTLWKLNSHRRRFVSEVTFDEVPRFLEWLIICLDAGKIKFKS